MVIATAFGPGIVGRVDDSLRRSTAVTRRNLAALRSIYWVVILSGLIEPLLYLFSIGLGVGTLVGKLPLPDGRLVPYAAFVAPSMLASSAMFGALSESTFNFFGKLKYMRLYDGVLATPVQPMDVAFGELLWAMIRGAIYSASFLGVMVLLGLTSPGWALAAFPATLLVGFAFGGLGMGLSTFMRSWQDFDLMATAQFALFLFSGTFAPVGSYPPLVRILVELTPLYHAVELVRGLTTGSLHLSLLAHVAYLAVMAGIGLLVAGRRMARLLLP
jgi:lipooligosaccharide transport system permease protein